MRSTDERRRAVSEATVYRLLKAQDRITGPAHIVVKAADAFRDKMRAGDVTATLDSVLTADGLDRVQVVHRPRLLTDTGSRCVAGDLADWLDSRGTIHFRGAPRRPQTQVTIERWHWTLETPTLLEHAYLPGEPESRVAAVVEPRDRIRAPESLGNLTRADVYFGRGEVVLHERARIERQTLFERRARHRAQAA